MKVSSFLYFLNEQNQKEIYSSYLNEGYKYPNININSIPYQTVYKHIHDKMWNFAKELIYGKGFSGDPLNNTIIIKYGDEQVNAAEVFLALWINIDQYTSETNIVKHNHQGRIEYETDGASSDYKKAPWYTMFVEDYGVNADYYTEGYMSDFINDVVALMYKYIDIGLYLSPNLKKYNLKNPENVKKYLRTGEFRQMMEGVADFSLNKELLSYTNNKKECIEGIKRRIQEGVIDNSSFGMEDYFDALYACKGFLELKTKRPEMVPETLGWNILYYIALYLYEFVLHYYATAISKSIVGYK
jgi:hypothetical protein